MTAFFPGQIVLADWRDALPKEPNKLRPAIVVDDSELFGSSYPNVILVSLSEDADFAIEELSLIIEPTAERLSEALPCVVALCHDELETANSADAITHSAGAAPCHPSTDHARDRPELCERG